MKFAQDFFDQSYYLSRNQDLSSLNISPWKHFLSAGFQEGRDYVDVSNRTFQDMVIALGPWGEDHPYYVRIAAAEVYFLRGDLDAVLRIISVIPASASSKVVSLDLSYFLALKRNKELPQRVRSFHDEGLLDFSWYSTHKKLLLEVIDSLIKKNLYKEAWELRLYIPDFQLNELIEKELEFISKLAPDESLINADGISSRTLAYQAETQQEVDIAIQAYARSVVLSHPEKEWISNHVDDLVMYKVQQEIDRNCLDNAYNFIYTRVESQKLKANSGQQIAIGALRIGEEALLHEYYELSERSISLIFQLNPTPITKSIAELYQLIIFANGWKGDDFIEFVNFYTYANEILQRHLKETAESDIQQLQAHLTRVAYRFEEKNSLIIALDIYRTANSLLPDFNEVSAQRISTIGRAVVQRLFEAGKREIALHYISELRREGFINKTRVHRLENVLSFAEASEISYGISRPQRMIEAPILRFLSTPRLTAIRGELTAPATYWAIIPNCTAFSRSNLIISGDLALYDLAADPRGTTARLGDVNTCDTQLLTLGASKTEIVVEYPSKSEAQILGNGIAMFGVQSQNYGHWLLEFLPRMLEFSRINEIPGAPIYVDSELPSAILESLRLLNTSGRPIQHLPSNGPCHFEKLAISSPPNFFPLDFKAGEQVIDTVWPKDVFYEMKSSIIAAIDREIPRQIVPKKRILISRNAHTSRSLMNFQEIEAYLKNEGFVVVIPENLTFHQQVKVFQSASIIVGSCSSALSNAIFCDEGTPVIGLIHDYSAFNFYGYASFIESGGAKVVFVQGEGIDSVGRHPFHMDYTIEISELKSALSLVMLDKFSVIFKDRSSAIKDRILNISTLFDRNYVSQQVTLGPSENSSIEELYLSGHLPKNVRPNPLFDIDYYRNLIGFDVSKTCTELEHYILSGAFDGINPSELFDSYFYLKNYTDVAVSGENPLAHFLRVGHVEGRLPFDSSSFDREAAISVACERDPTNPLLRSILYLSRLLNGNLVALNEEIRTEDFPFAAGLVFSGCIQLETEGRFPEALMGYQALLRVQPDNALCLFKLGVLLRRLGYLNFSDRHLTRAFALSKDVPYIASAFKTTSQHLMQAEIDLADAKIAYDLHNYPLAQQRALSSDAARWTDTNLLERLSVTTIERRPEILLFDTSFPERISSFRYGEFSFYLKRISECSLLSSTWDLGQFGGGNSFAQATLDYCKNSGISYSRIKSFDVKRNIHPSLTYAVFLNNAAIISNKAIFRTDAYAFTLYPGGGFNLNNKASDRLLERICGDSRFAKVITTQRLTYDYLVSNGFCSPDKILHRFGGIVPSCLHPSPLRRIESSDCFDWSAPIEVVRPLVWLLSLEDGQDGKTPEARGDCCQATAGGCADLTGPERCRCNPRAGREFSDILPVAA